MYILKKEGRETYLGFLRNLTPQIIILSMLVVIVSKTNWKQSGSDVFVGGFLIFVLTAMFITAAWANSAMFLEGVQYFIQAEKAAINDKFKEKKWSEKIMYTWKNHTWLFMEILLVLSFVEIGLVSVVVIGAANASNLIKNFT